MRISFRKINNFFFFFLIFCRNRFEQRSRCVCYRGRTAGSRTFGEVGHFLQNPARGHGQIMSTGEFLITSSDFHLSWLAPSLSNPPTRKAAVFGKYLDGKFSKPNFLKKNRSFRPPRWSARRGCVPFYKNTERKPLSPVLQPPVIPASSDGGLNAD